MDPHEQDIQLVGRIRAVPTILDVVCRITGMGFAAVARVTDERWIACSVLDHIRFGLKPGGELKLESTICHEIRQCGKAVIIDEVAQDLEFKEHHTPRMYGFQSYISFPITMPDGRFFGTLCAIDPKPASLNSPEISGMFALFAELIAYHLHAEEKLITAESTLHEERQVSELREQFIGVLGHDLRNPLGALSMGTTLLRDTDLDEDQIHTVDMMQRSVDRMSNLINDAMDFTRGRLGGGMTLQVQEDRLIGHLLQQVIDEILAASPEREVIANFDLSDPVRYDSGRIAQLFSNLLANAITHGFPATPVTVRALSGGGSFELSVSNAARPIPPDLLERIFEPFSRGGAGNYQQGMGLGLYIASQIAHAHGGKLEALSDENETRFSLLIPAP